MAYPAIPPSTENKVVSKAKRQAVSGRDKTIGASMTSGGIGKKEDSAKLNPHRFRGAYLCFDQLRTLSYRPENIFIIMTFA